MARARSVVLEAGLAAGMRPLLSVDHLVLYTPHGDSGATLIADKQLYASHYFEAAFYITARGRAARAAARIWWCCGGIGSTS
jgi:hypothetical protein